MTAGQVLGDRYRLEAMLGATAMGEVWRATDTVLDRDVAVKRVWCHDGDIDRACRRLWREARIAAGVRHTRIVAVFDVVVDGDVPWLVMEYVRSRNLGEAVRVDGRMEPKRVAGIGAQVAEALQATCAAGVVHGDIKPGNILLTDDDSAKITDFGIARAMRPGVTMTDLGLLCGTPAYLPPEVARGEEPTPASDVFSLGASLFAAVEGGSPYGPSDDALVMYGRARSAELTPCRHAGPLAPVLRRLLAVDPRRRPDAATAVRLLRGVAEGAVPLRELRPAPLGRAVARLRHLPRQRRALLAAGTAAAVAAGAVLLSQSGSPPKDSQASQLVNGVGAAPIGDPRTVDPCALASATPMNRYGQAQVTSDYGAFDRCDVVIQTADNATIDVEDQFQAPGSSVPSAPSETTKIGRFNVVRTPDQSGECDRFILLSGGYSVVVSASASGSGPSNLCQMADTATDVAVSALGHGTLPRRTAPADSLVHLDACTLLDSKALTAVPGVAASNHDASFGDWGCQWTSATSGSTVELRFDQNDPLTSSDGHPETLGGRQAYILPGGDGGDDCLARVVARSFTDSGGNPTEELLYLVVSGNQPETQLCQPATRLAAAASAQLTAEESHAK